MDNNLSKQNKLMTPGEWYVEFDEKGNNTVSVYDESYRKLLGYDQNEKFADSNNAWLESVHPEDRERVDAHLSECMAKNPDGKDFDIEYRMMTKRGYRWFHDFAHITRREDGSPSRADGVVFDIQEGHDKVSIINHQQLLNEVFDYMVAHVDADPIELLKLFAERIRALIDCDQVIYRDLEETRIMVNSPAIENTWSVPIEYCRQCEHFDAHHPMYKDGYTEMENCQEGWQGIPVYKDCPIKSSLTRIVYCDGEVAGYLAIHYVQNYHHFTEVERITLEDFARILSVSISRYEAKKRKGESDSVKKMLNMLFSLSSEYDPIIVVDAESGEYDWYMSQADELTVNTSMTLHGESLYKNIGIDSASIIHPDDRAQFQAFYTRENIMKIAETGEMQETENRWFLKLEGRYKWKYNKAVRMIDDNGKAYVVVGVIDTTEQKEKKEEYKKQKKLIEEQQALSDGLAREYHTVWLIEGSGEHKLHLYRSTGKKTVQKAVQMGLDVPRYTPSMIKYVNECVHEDDRERVLEETKFETIEKETPDIGTYVVSYKRYCDEEGNVDYHQMCFAKAVSENGTVNYILAYRDADKTIREQMEEQRVLQESLTRAEEANAKIAEQAAFTNYFLEPYQSAYYVGLDDMSIKIYKRTTGIEEKYPIMENYLDSLYEYIDNEVHPDDRKKFKELAHPKQMKKLLSKQSQFSYIFRSLYDGKSEFIRFQVIRGADENHAAFGFRDVTQEILEQEKQQKQLEEALAMAQSANRAKTTFLNNMSHDIRTPMNAIIGYTGLAASHIDNKEQVQGYLTKIGQSSDHLLSLINDVLDMSRIESGKMNLDEKGEHLPDIISTLRDIVQADIRSRQHDFFIDTVNVNDENVICDKLRLNQVLLNVLSNSIKYTAPGGTISMRITEKAIKPSGYATYEFRIKDNGMGMEEGFLDTIFDPFTRVKSTTISGIQGTGLGMAITKNIVDMMGGKIEIKSELGKGTETVITFDFKLLEAHRDSIVIPELKGFSSLVVDDDVNTAISISKMIKDIGMRPVWCTSGKEAILRAEDGTKNGDPFMVYVIDWLMPDMNGIETARRIRAIIGDECPIIILTAYDWSDIEEEAKEAGVSAFVSKPMFPSDLQKALNFCLGKPYETPKIVVDYDFSGKKILLVEDNELNREIAVEILQEDGFILDIADDGDIAVEKMKNAKAGDYDLVLMDVQMPRMNGYEATKIIREMGGELSQIPIIAMTANAFEEDRRAALEAGMNEHIAKPIDIVKLKQTLKKFL